MKRAIVRIGISVLIAVALTEITLTLFFPIDDPLRESKLRSSGFKYIESQFFPNEAYIFYPESSLRHMASQTRFSVNNVGFRGARLAMPKPADEYRILMVGGSAAECLYLDDSATITSDLERYLNANVSGGTVFRVYNAGKGGDRSFDHIAMISQRIVHLDPDMIILFAGLNDLTAAIAKTDYLHMPQSRRQAFSFIDLVGLVATEFQIPRRVSRLVSTMSKKDVRQQIPFHSDYQRLVEINKSYPVSATPPNLNLVAYETNLRTIIGIAAAHRIRLVLMTQPTTWNSKIEPQAVDWHWMNCGENVRFREQDMDHAMETYNDVVRNLAREYGVPGLDLARALPKSLDLIYDDCHFNINGAGYAASLLGKMLVTDSLLP